MMGLVVQMDINYSKSVKFSKISPFLFQNNTYVANVGYPTALTTGAARTCTYTVNRIGGNNICQLRLDFQTVVITTGTKGVTNTTSGSTIQALGKSGVEPPLVSGTLSGDHSKAPQPQ